MLSDEAGEHVCSGMALVDHGRTPLADAYRVRAEYAGEYPSAFGNQGEFSTFGRKETPSEADFGHP